MTDEMIQTHLFVTGTCEHCGADDHDIDLPDQCVPHEAGAWTFTAQSNPLANDD